MKRLTASLFALTLAVLLGLCARQWLLSFERIAGSSMAETLRSGDVALVTRADYLAGNTPERGDVVQCRFSGRDGSYVKRVIGLPGDVVAFEDGALVVNSRPVSEPYISSPTEDFLIELGADEYLVLGDNRAESYDSRSDDMGCISSDNFLGRVRWIVWPPDRFGPVE